MKAFRCFFDQVENQMMWFYPVRSTLQITVLHSCRYATACPGAWRFRSSKPGMLALDLAPLVSVVAAKKRTEPDSHIRMHKA